MMIDSTSDAPASSREQAATGFHLGAGIARIGLAQTTIAKHGQRRRELLGRIGEQRRQCDLATRRREEARQRELTQATEAVAAEERATEASIERWLAGWQRRLETLRRWVLQRSTDVAAEAVDETDSGVDRAALQRATQRFAAFDATVQAIGALRRRLDEGCRRLGLQPVAVDPLPALAGPPDRLLAELQEELTAARSKLEALRHWSGRLLPRPLAGLLSAGLSLLLGGLATWSAWQAGWQSTALIVLGGIALLAGIVVGVLLDLAGRRRQDNLQAVAEGIGTALALADEQIERGRRQLDPQVVLADQADALLAAEQARTKAAAAAQSERTALREALRRRIQGLAERLPVIERRWRRQHCERFAAEGRRLAELRRSREEQDASAYARECEHLASARSEHESAIIDDIVKEVSDLHTELQRSNEQLRAEQHDWNWPGWQDWQTPTTFPVVVPVARLACSCHQLLEAAEAALEPAPATLPDELTLCADLVLPEAGLLLIQGADGSPILHQAMLRLLVGSPPGKVRFSLIDPVGLGTGFAPFLQLTDRDARLVGAKVWTTPVEIERLLADLAEHAEKVIQKFLRDRYATLADYNQAAGDLAEPYQVLVLEDFPQGFSDLALERLDGLLQHGPRCGIFVWIHSDAERDLPAPLTTALFSERGIVLQRGATGWSVPQAALRDWSCHPEALPSPERFDRLLTEVGRRTAAAADIAVPLPPALQDPTERWRRDAAAELRIPIGQSGADGVQELCLGRGTAQHVLIGGRTGSGKSTLLHALITAGACCFAPEELEFFLIDFKKGVEFKIYANAQLPHARVVAVESDRAFGLSVLQHIDRQLDERGQRFRAAGVQDLAGFRQARPDEPLPRSLLVIDEFQELFVEDDATAHDAAMLLDRFVRQGRAFGMHVVLGSQSIGGAGNLARSTIGQIGVRIALQCSEADSQLLLGDDNTAARLLERPGEAIYNDRSGQRAGNAPFQVYWLDDDRQRRLLADLPRPEDRRPVVFEGGQPAELDANPALQEQLAGGPALAVPTCWLGEPNALGSPCRVAFGPGAAGNLLVVGHHRAAALGMAIAGIIGAATGRSPERLRFRIVLGDTADDRAQDQLSALAERLPHDCELIRPGEAGSAITALADQVHDRAADEATTLLVVLGLQRLPDLRQSDAFAFDQQQGPGDRFAELLAAGPDAGVHSWIWCDSVANLGRSLNRSAQRSIGLRVAFQMSVGDSSDLLDDGSANRLGLHHALYADQLGGDRLTFRPYGPLPMDRFNDLLAGVGQRWSS